MYYCPMGIHYSKDNIIFYGFDIETIYMVKAIVSFSVAKKIQLGKIYEVKEKFDKCGLPIMYIIDCKEVSDIENNKNQVIEYSSSCAGRFLSTYDYGGIIRIRELYDIVVSNENVYIKASIIGVKPDIYEIIIDDLRWINYWKYQKDFAEVELIKKYLMSHKVYGFLEPGEKIIGNIIKVPAMVII